jgi:undecaprenyl-diphosphatase
MNKLIERALTCCLLVGFVFLSASPAAAQNCGWSRIDHEIGYSESGIWKPGVYRDLMNTMTLAEVAGALWEGSDSRLGLTLWRGIDSQLIGAAGAEAGKRIFRRERPATENNPCVWFRDSNHSFPSAEATNAAALITPYLLEYGEDQPAVYGLVAIPAYVGVARLRNHAHWQSDILSGWGLGAASGYYAFSREAPILVSILPSGITVGLRREF